MDKGIASKWLAAGLYSVQIYCDFSGYSDMAIAAAGLLGYRLAENFRHPYIAQNIQDLWARWHISLSTWIRDYCKSWAKAAGRAFFRWETAPPVQLTAIFGSGPSIETQAPISCGLEGAGDNGVVPL